MNVFSQSLSPPVVAFINTPIRAIARRLETVEEIAGNGPAHQDSWAVGWQQPNSGTAICSCVRGGTGALTRAVGNDVQQVTGVHVQVPQGWCEGHFNWPEYSDWQI